MKKIWEDAEFLSDNFHAVVEPENVPAALQEMTERTIHHKTDPSYLEIYSIVKEKRYKDGEKTLVLAHIEPINANANLLMAETPEDCYFRKENGTIGELPLSWFKKNGMTDELIDDIISQGMFFQYKDRGEIKTFIPSKYCLATLCKQIGAGKPQPGINPLRDMYIASVMNCNNDITIIARSGDKFNKIYGVLADGTRRVPQTIALDILEKIRENESAEIIGCDITHEETFVDVELTNRFIYGYHPVIRIRMGDIGRIGFRLFAGLNAGDNVIITGDLQAKKTAPADISMKIMLERAFREIDSYNERFKPLKDAEILSDVEAEIKKMADKINLSETVGLTAGQKIVEKLIENVSGNRKKDIIRAFLNIPKIAKELNVYTYKIRRLETVIGNMF